MASTDLKVNIIGDAKSLKKVFAQTEKEAGTWGSKLKEISKKTAIAVGGAFAAGVGGVVAGGKVLYDIGSTFDAAIDTIRIGAGATGEALEELGEDFKSVFSSVPAEADVVATAIADLNTRLGLTGEPLQDITTKFVELSRITGTDVATNIKLATRAFNAWGISAEDQSEALDKLWRASQSTGIGIDALSTNLTKFGPTLQQLGFEFDETVTLLSKFEKEGVNTEAVLGAMRRGLATMAKEGEPAQETLSRVVEEIENAGTMAEANAIAVEIFGSRAGPEMASAIREGRFELGELLEVVSDGEETILAAAEDTASFAETWQKLKNNVLVKLEPVASAVFEAVGDSMASLAPIVEEVAGWLSERLPEAVDTFSGWIDKGIATLEHLWGVFSEGEDFADGIRGVGESIRLMLPEGLTEKVSGFTTALMILTGPMGLIVRELLPALGPVFAAVLPHLAQIANDLAPALAQIFAEIAETVIPALVSALGWVADILGNHPEVINAVIGALVALKTVALVQWVAGAVPKIVGALNTLKVAFLANPFGIIAAAVTALVVLIVANWDKIKEYLLKAWNWIKDTATRVWNGIKDYFSRLWEGVKAVFSKALEIVKGYFLNWTAPGLIIKHWDKIKGAATAVKDWIVDKFNAVVSFFKNLPSRITSAVSGLFQKVKDLAVEAKNWVRDRFEDVLNFIRGLPGRISSAAKGMWDGIKNAFRDAINFLVNAWNKIDIKIGPFKVPDWVPVLGGKKWETGDLVPDIPSFHTGGIVPGRPGQEVLALLEAGERVLSRAEVARGGAGGDTHITVYAETNADPEQIAAAIAWASKTGGL